MISPHYSFIDLLYMCSSIIFEGRRAFHLSFTTPTVLDTTRLRAKKELFTRGSAYFKTLIACDRVFFGAQLKKSALRRVSMIQYCIEKNIGGAFLGAFLRAFPLFSGLFSLFSSFYHISLDKLFFYIM